jgi:hypothetical protein
MGGDNFCANGDNCGCAGDPYVGVQQRSGVKQRHGRFAEIRYKLEAAEP